MYKDAAGLGQAIYMGFLTRTPLVCAKLYTWTFVIALTLYIVIHVIWNLYALLHGWGVCLS